MPDPSKLQVRQSSNEDEDIATREFVEAYAKHVGGTVVESEHFYTVIPKETPCAESD
jgi:predicted RNA methylase